MNWQQLVTSALVGAVIGYITNWTAIKMLFRPLDAKRVLGVRLPFTPGVIPKEKTRLAESIGNTVSKHLLTREYIFSQLVTPQAEDKLYIFIKEKLDSAGDKTWREALGALGVDDGAREDGLARVGILFLESVRDRQAQDFAAAYLAEKTVQFLNSPPAGILESKEYKFLKDLLAEGLSRSLARHEMQEQLSQFLTATLDKMMSSPLALKECIPEPVLGAVKLYVREQSPAIAGMINDYLKSPEIKQMLVNQVSSFFEQGLVRKFMGNVLHWTGYGSTEVADRIVEEVAAFFAESENRELLAEKLEEMLDLLLGRQVCDLAAHLELGGWLGDYLCTEKKLEKIIENLLAGAENALANSGMTWGGLWGLNDTGKAKDKAYEHYQGLLDKITTSPGFERVFNKLAARAADRVLDAKIGGLYALVFGNQELPREKIIHYYHCFARKYLGEILAFIDFRQLVTRRVNDLDILQVEELVLGIMRRELVAITWFGAVLGAGIGITMVFVQTFFTR